MKDPLEDYLLEWDIDKKYINSNPDVFDNIAEQDDSEIREIYNELKYEFRKALPIPNQINSLDDVQLTIDFIRKMLDSLSENIKELNERN